LSKFTDERKNLILLMEECAEVTQICAKILRFGIDDMNPNNQKINRQLLEEELGDVQAIIGILIENQYVRPMQISIHELKKLKKLEKWYEV